MQERLNESFRVESAARRGWIEIEKESRRAGKERRRGWREKGRQKEGEE